MSPLACRTCGEPVVPAPQTTRLGYSHAGASDHDVDLIEAPTVALVPLASVHSRDEGEKWQAGL